MCWEAISAVAGGVGALGSLFGGGSEGGGTQTTAQAPMPWEKDAKRFWDEFVNNWYGVPATAAAGTTGVSGKLNLVPIYYSETDGVITTNPTSILKGYVGAEDITEDGRLRLGHKKIYSEEEALRMVIDAVATPDTTTPVVTPGQLSYQQRLEQDIAAKQKAGEKFIGAVTAAEQPYSSLLQNVMTQPGQYYKPIGFKAGDFQTSFVPRTDIRMVDELKKTAQEQAALGTGAAGRELALAEQFTPNRAFMDYMDKLQNMAMALQAQRYGLPTQTTSATGTYTPGWGEVLSNAINTGLKVYQGLNLGKTTTPLPSTTAINTADIWDPSKLFSNVSW